eukprot:Gb_01383 [translate_table: standard]
MVQIEVCPEDLRFTQDSIKNRFRPPYQSLRVDDAVERIQKKVLSANEFTTMNVVKERGVLWSLDNRRLWVFRKAGVSVVNVNLVSPNYSPRSVEFFRTLEPYLERRYSSRSYYPRVRGAIRAIRSSTVVRPDAAAIPSKFQMDRVTEINIQPPPTSGWPPLQPSERPVVNIPQNASAKQYRDLVMEIGTYQPNSQERLFEGPGDVKKTRGTAALGESLQPRPTHDVYIDIHQIERRAAGLAPTDASSAHKDGEESGNSKGFLGFLRKIFRPSGLFVRKVFDGVFFLLRITYK